MIKIEKLTNGFKVEGIDNVLYPDNGTLVFGPKTVILVTDESDMVTFRSASNFDVLFSGLIENITIDGESVTKDNIVEKFQAIANVEQGSQEDVNSRLEQIEGEVALKANSADLLTLFDSAEYNSQTKKIVFKHGDTVLVQIDATDFIKDGMVSNVEIVDNKLIISFNTDSGKENIEIPLSEIFNPNDYYTKAQIDAKEQNINASIALKANAEDVYDKQTANSTFATQTVVNEEIAARIQRDSEIEQSLASKADKSNTYSKSEVDDAIANVDVSEQLTNYETIANHNADKALLEASISLKVDQETFDTKEEVISKALNDLHDSIPTVPTNVSEFTNDAGYITQNDIANKQDKLTAGENITIENNVISSTGGTQVQSDWNQTDVEAVDYIKNKPTIPTVPTNVSEFTNDAGYITQNEVKVSEVVQKTDANDNYMSNTFVTSSNKVVTVGNAMSDSSKTHTFGYDKTYTDIKEQTFAKPFNQAKIQDWIDAGFVTEENITLNYSGEGTAQPIPSYRLKVNIPSDIQARLVAKEKMTLAEMRFIKKSDNTELVVPVGNFSCDAMTDGNVYWFKDGIGYGGDGTPKVEEIETQYGFCVQFEGQYTGSTIQYAQLHNGCMSNIPSKSVKNIQILFDGNIWNETFRLYNESLNSYVEYSFVDFKFVGEMADTITETIINTKVNNYDEHPEKLNEYIRFANDVKAKILTDKNIDEVVDIEAKQDKLVSGTNIKTINGASVLGEGNLTITTDMTNYYTKQEIDNKFSEVDNKFSEVETTLSQI